MLKVALLLGGPSEERAISLNSARSLSDHFDEREIALAEVIYFDRAERPYSISRALLYSNNPGDFDFKLSQTATSLSRDAFAERLGRCDIAFPVMHGRFGEDGRIQQVLEELGVAFVGSSSEACRTAYDKYLAHVRLVDQGLPTVTSMLLTPEVAAGDDVGSWLVSQLDRAGAVVFKPAAGGSSIDVTVADSMESATAGLADLFARHDRLVAQPWVRGTEFTAVVLESAEGPVALPPVEIEMSYRATAHDIFSFRRKYLPTNDTRYHCPPRFEPDVVDEIRSKAEMAFRVLGMRDFARIDGWLDAEGGVLLSDVNPISGMEQNSFLFIEAAEVGMTHHDALRFILNAACRRTQRPLIAASVGSVATEPPGTGPMRVRVPVLFGGPTAERQVSVLSGTNVWLKLQRSSRYDPYPCLLDRDGAVWLLSYPAALRHTVEEISLVCEEANDREPMRQKIAADVVRRLGLTDEDLGAAIDPPEKVGLSQFLDGCSVVFNALHGGAGEDGTLQAELDRRGIRYNGSGPVVSARCMDKFEAGDWVDAMGDPAIRIPRRVKLPLFFPFDTARAEKAWALAKARIQSVAMVIKPVADGCSAGVVPLDGADELASYVLYLDVGVRRMPAGRFRLLEPEQVIEQPSPGITEFMLEEYVETDNIAVVEGGRDDQAEPVRLDWGTTRDTGWVEVTVGVVGHHGSLRALPPSMTIARRGVLSVEEKFMGGTGINITPPPSPPLGRVQPSAVTLAQQHALRIAEALGIEGYARIDAFVHRETGDVIFIEANTLPALTPSTVLYHQALAEDPPQFPLPFLEYLLDLAIGER